MKSIKSLVSLLLALTLALSLNACGTQANTEPEQTDDTPTPAEVNLYVLSGPTGIGAMNLWAAADAGETQNTYHITMPGANDEVVAAISNGDADIAAVATNLAAILYNKTSGGVTVLEADELSLSAVKAALLRGAKQVEGRRGRAMCVARSQKTKREKTNAGVKRRVNGMLFTVKCALQDFTTREDGWHVMDR